MCLQKLSSLLHGSFSARTETAKALRRSFRSEEKSARGVSRLLEVGGQLELTIFDTRHGRSNSFFEAVFLLLRTLAVPLQIDIER